MAQINFHTTPEFEADLEALMKRRGLRTKSEAIRLAVHELATRPAPQRDLSGLIGLIDRLPGKRKTAKSAAELLAEIDAEMDAKLARLGRRD
jgi:Arc/MetJ-type ribon-helix-helix transcriptional regulator